MLSGKTKVCLGVKLLKNTFPPLLPRRGLLLLLTSGLEQNTVLPSEEVGGRLWELLFTVGAPRGRKKEVFLMFKLNPFTQKHLSQIFLSLLSLVMSWHWQVLKSQYFQINFSHRFCFCPKNCPLHSSLSKVVKKDHLVPLHLANSRNIWDTWICWAWRRMKANVSICLGNPLPQHSPLPRINVFPLF